MKWHTIVMLRAVAALLFSVCAVLTTSAQGTASQPAPNALQVPAWQVAAGGKMEFEVASIHRGDPDKFIRANVGMGIEDTSVPPGGRFIADFPLLNFITFAYKQQLTQEQRDRMLSHLPGWISSQPFVIEAKANGNPTKDQLRLMMQSLLADRFKLAVHFEARQTHVLAVELVKPGVTGPRLRPHSEGLACDAKWSAPSDPTSPAVAPGGFLPACGNVALRDGPNQTILFGGRNVPMEHIALYLPAVYSLGRAVIDQTGLTGRFDFSLDWAPDPDGSVDTAFGGSTDLEGSSFFGALKDQLGLKLKQTTAPIQTLVIDHVEQPSPN
jgi:uncharacterized protein (TIGR03435 family)